MTRPFPTTRTYHAATFTRMMAALHTVFVPLFRSLLQKLPLTEQQAAALQKVRDARSLPARHVWASRVRISAVSPLSQHRVLATVTRVTPSCALRLSYQAPKQPNGQKKLHIDVVNEFEAREGSHGMGLPSRDTHRRTVRATQASAALFERHRGELETPLARFEHAALDTALRVPPGLTHAPAPMEPVRSLCSLPVPPLMHPLLRGCACFRTDTEAKDRASIAVVDILPVFVLRSVWPCP